MNDLVPVMGIFVAVHIQPDGNFRHLPPAEALSFQPDAGLVWLHLDRCSETAQSWLYERSGIDEIDVVALLSEETRPRAYRPGQQASLLVILRGVNNQPGADPEDMVSIRIWVEKHRVLSFSSRPLAPVNDVLAMFGGAYAPVNAAELLAGLATQMVVRMEPAINALGDRIDEFEELLDAGRRIDTAALMVVRRNGAALRRFLGPQKDVFVTIDSLNLPWLGITVEEEWREATNTLYRYIEELDALRERIAIINESLNQRAVARANKTVYAVSVAVAFFVPFTFVTGLMGMNVGGIPFAHHPYGFVMMLSGLAVWALIQALIFRRIRWL